MTANRFLTREPYGDESPPRTAFFREPAPLWISPVWALGTLIAKSVSAYGWPSRFTDYRRIALEDLAVHSVEDEMIPFAMGRRLFEAAPEPKHFLELQGSHNEAHIFYRDVYMKGVREFLGKYFNERK